MTTGTATLAPGHTVTGTGSADTGSAQPSPAALTAYMSGGTDGASYTAASTFDTVPMANQSGRIAVTLNNTGTSTWSGYGLAALVYPAGDTSGTGTLVTTGPTVGIAGTVAPGGTTTVESVTPAENPGSYEICLDVVNDAERSDPGGSKVW